MISSVLLISLLQICNLMQKRFTFYPLICHHKYLLNTNQGNDLHRVVGLTVRDRVSGHSPDMDWQYVQDRKELIRNREREREVQRGTAWEGDPAARSSRKQRSTAVWSAPSCSRYRQLSAAAAAQRASSKFKKPMVAFLKSTHVK